LTEIKKSRDRTTITPVEEDETTGVSPKDEPVKDPAVQPRDLWPKDEPVKDPTIQPTDLWPKDEPVKDAAVQSTADDDRLQDEPAKDGD
jgi:hypothetical protein